MTPEILSRLTASALDMRRAEASGGTPEHTREELMGCLARLDHGPSYLAQYVYLGNAEYRSWLKNEIRLKLAGIWDKHNWEIAKPGHLTGLSELAVRDLEPEFRRCPVCKGRKGYTKSLRTRYGFRSEWVNCGKCEGSGERRIREGERARIVGIHHMVWKRREAERYQRYVEPITRDWDEEIRKALNVGLRG